MTFVIAYPIFYTFYLSFFKTPPSLSMDDKIFFVQQDNWALPAVENALLDAYYYAPLIRAGLPSRAR